MKIEKLTTNNILGNENMKYSIDFNGQKRYFTEKALIELQSKLNEFFLHDVSSSITVSNGCQPTQKQIHSNSNWFTEEYYTLNDDGECIVITKCYMEIPKNAHKFKKNNAFSLITDMPNGKFEFDEESTEDELVIYYR